MNKPRIGGQSVIEGVMMKYGDKYAVAVRKPDNEIEVKIEEYKSIGEKYKILKLPIIRGVVNFIESMIIGVKTLTYSAEFYDEEENNDEKGIAKENTGEGEKKKTSDDIMTAATVFFSLVIAVALFMLLPAFLADLAGKFIKSEILIAVIEGVLRLVIFLAYVVLISLMKDIKRVFMYHGAEHKSINCFEAGEALTPENIKKYSRYHKRCGTSFLFVVIFISIIVFMFVRVDNLWLKLLTRILLVPVIAGVSYEIIMFTGRSDSWFANALSVPGKWVQRLTTREPDMDMIEVAIKSVEGVIDWREYVDSDK